MITRIVYIVDYPFNARDYDRFGIDTMRTHGFDVEVWDLSALLLPGLRADALGASPMTGPELQRFDSRGSVIEAIRALTGADFVCCLPGYRRVTAFLFRALSKSPSRWALMANLALPLVAPSEMPGYVWSKVRRLTPHRVIEALFPRLPPSWFGVRAADAVLVSAAGTPNGPLVGSRTDLVRVHSFDYDTYLTCTKTPGETDASLAIFIDQFMPFHPDWVDYPGGPLIAPDAYYALLRGFFDRVERETSVRVTIAAHPRGDYDGHPDYFGGRTIVRHATADLVRRARFVITESSQALGFAVLFRKPAVIITTDAYETSTRPVSAEFREQIRLTARHLGTVPVNIERADPIDWVRLLTVDQGAYDLFQSSYIKPAGTPRDYYWNIVAGYLRSVA